MRAAKEKFGVSRAELVGTSLGVTGLERTISGGWEEIWRSLKTVEFFDLDRIVEYVLLLLKATKASKAGYCSEEHREYLKVEERHSRRSAVDTCGGPYVDRRTDGNGCLVAACKLVVLRELTERYSAQVT